MSDPQSPSIISGLVGWYTGLSAEVTSGSVSSWKDISGQGNHASTIRGSPKVDSVGVSVRGVPFLWGGTGDGLQFPTTVMNAASPNYTLFHVARYYKPTGAPTRRRIFDGLGNNWLSGFHQNAVGGAYHAGTNWITPITDLHGIQWVLSTDQRNMYRSNGTDRTTATYTDSKSTQLTINYGQYVASESSDWAVAEVIVFNRELTSAEYLSVEAYLIAKYFYDKAVPATGVISGSLAKAIFYDKTLGEYPLSISRLGEEVGSTYGTQFSASSFRISQGLVRRTYSHTMTAHPNNGDEFTTYLNNSAYLTAGPEVVSDINNLTTNSADYYAMIWTGFIYIATAGTYTFGTNSDDASDMYVDVDFVGRSLVADAYGGHGVAANLTPFGPNQFTANLTKGYHRFYYRFEERGGGDGYQALWKPPGVTTWALIPSSVFYHDIRDLDTSLSPFDPYAYPELGALDQIYLNIYEQVLAAYAIRRLFTVYRGPQVRIRRSTDNAETDVYFTTNGYIRNFNLTTWLGGGTAYVRTWYDQSGNGNNVIQATAGSQPILTAPIGEPAYIRFQSKIMTGPNVFGTSSVTNMHMISTMRENSRSANYFVSLNGTNTNGESGRFFIHSPLSNGTWYWDPGSATTNRAYGATSAVGTKVVFSGYKSSADGNNGFRLNAGTRFLSSGTTSGDVTGGIRIGSDSTDHSIYDLIIFSSKLSAANESYIEYVLNPSPSLATGVASGTWTHIAVNYYYDGALKLQSRWRINSRVGTDTSLYTHGPPIPSQDWPTTINTSNGLTTIQSYYETNGTTAPPNETNPGPVGVVLINGVWTMTINQTS